MTFQIRKRNPEIGQRYDLRLPSSTREEVVKAFSEAWFKGHAFSIVMDDQGVIKVKAGTKIVGHYADAGEFAKQFMPEALK